jgi:hypothetical protein
MPLHPHSKHQLVRNQGITLFQTRDSTRNVIASQFGQRSPSGRRRKKITVAAMPRSTKKPPKIITKITVSDIPHLGRRFYD